MRVAHFIQRYPPALGGSEAYFARLSRYLADHGDEVVVFTTTALDLEAFWSSRGRLIDPGTDRDGDVEVRRFSLWRCPGRRYLLKAVSLIPHRGLQCLTLPCNPIAPKMWSVAGKTSEKFDVVHASAFPYAWPIACARRLARRLGIPFFLTPFLHLGDPEDDRDRTRRAYLSGPLRYLLKSANKVFAQTELEQAAIQQVGVQGDKITVSGMGVEPAQCTGGDRQRSRIQWKASPDEIVIGHLANNSVEKGTVDLLRAAELVLHSGRRCRFVLAGPEMPNFQRFWKTYGPSGVVLRLGPLTEEQKRDFFAGIDLFCLPSRSDSFGLVILEAWANGVPSIAYRAGGLADVIRHEKDGLLVRCGDINGLADAMVRLADDQSLRQKFGRNGLARTKTDFQWNDKLERVRVAYSVNQGSVINRSVNQ